MNKFLYLPIIFVIIFLTGCRLTNSEKVQRTKDGLGETRTFLAKNTEDKLSTISTYAAGTDYSLKSVTNPPVQVITALELNDRVISIAGNPNLDELNKIKQMINLLNSEVDTERVKGDRLLKVKDQEIVDLQVQRKEIENAYETQIKGLETQATEVAKKADKLQGVVNEVNSYFGLGGVFYGIKRFISSAVIFILIFGVLFLALRFFATMNPIAGAIFSIFEHIASYLISLIKGIVPNAVKFSNHVESNIFDKYKNTLDSIVDILEKMKSTQKETGIKYTMDDMLIKFDKDLNDPDKKLIDELKVNNKYG